MKKRLITISVVLLLLAGSAYAVVNVWPAILKTYHLVRFPSKFNVGIPWGTHKDNIAYVTDYENGKWISESDKCLIYDIEVHRDYYKSIVHYFNDSMKLYKVVQNLMSPYIDGLGMNQFFHHEYSVFYKSLESVPNKVTYEFNWLENGESKTRTFVSDYYLMWIYEDDKIKLAVSEYAGSPNDITITMIHSSFEISGGVLVEQYFVAGETEADEDKLYIAYTYLKLAPGE